MKVYADHAATTKLDPVAFEAMLPYLVEEFGNASQEYSFAREPKKALKEAREAIAECIGAHPEEIYFTSGGTESDNWAIKGSALSSAGERNQTITSKIEHHAVLHSCRTIERLRYPVEYLTPTKTGIITRECLLKHLSDRTHLVSIMLANNEIGSIQPIRELAAITHEHGALFHTDAVQSVGHIPVDVRHLDVDLLSASAHKFNGPKGVGFLYIRNGISILPYVDGGSQEGQLRAGTENVAGIVGMSVALMISIKEMTHRTIHLKRLEEYLLRRLSDFSVDYIVNGDSNHTPGNLSISFRNASGEALLHRLDLMGICVSTGSACNSQTTELSHVLKAINVPLEYAHGTIRISLGYENTKEEIDLITDSIKKVLS